MPPKKSPKKASSQKERPQKETPQKETPQKASSTIKDKIVAKRKEVETQKLRMQQTEDRQVNLERRRIIEQVRLTHLNQQLNALIDQL